MLGGLGGLGVAGLAGCASLARPQLHGNPSPPGAAAAHSMENLLVGDVPAAVNGFDPSAILTDFDYGQVSVLPGGQTLREYQLVAADRSIEVAPGITFAAWAYNERVPGPTIRCTAGDRVRITFTNGSSHPHSIHFHGFHDVGMDGVTPVPPGKQTVYEFDAGPFGLHIYHCHVPPFMQHIHRGLYGMFIVDPPTPRPPARELALVMNAFDTNGDGENEIYAVNTVGFHFTRHPISLKTGELVRVYLSNFIEFDPVNSFHLHANMFNLYRTGTRLEPSEFTDIVTMGQGERHILEFTYTRPGSYMFHAHQSSFNSRGWMGIFEVSADGLASPAYDSARRLGICSIG
jgi:FtsP/CotA-like multicopper oxidase with cupredoxin domain